MRRSCIGFALLTAWLVAACASQPPEPLAEPPRSSTSTDGTVTVHVTRVLKRGNMDPVTARRLLADRPGHLELCAGWGELTLEVGQVLDGALSSNTVRVILLDEAAHLVPIVDVGFEGTWRLHRLPTGGFVVSALKDTPFAGKSVRARERLLAKITAGLASDDPDFQTLALVSLRGHHFVGLIPQVIPLLESDATAVAQPWIANQYGPVGRQAEIALHTLVSSFDDGHLPCNERMGCPRLSSVRTDWEDWWADLAEPEAR